MLTNALVYCLTQPSGISLNALWGATTVAASLGQIDPVNNLNKTKVILFTGKQSSSIQKGVSLQSCLHILQAPRILLSFQESLQSPINITNVTCHPQTSNSSTKLFQPLTDGSNLHQSNSLSLTFQILFFSHFFFFLIIIFVRPTINYEAACGTFAFPYMINCKYDWAGTLLEWIYGPLNKPTTASGQLLVFDQSYYTGTNSPSQISLATRGVVYIPVYSSDIFGTFFPINCVCFFFFSRLDAQMEKFPADSTFLSMDA